MALKKREKKMVIALGIIALLGGLKLYFVYKPDKAAPEVIVESEETTVKDSAKKTSSAKKTRRSYSGGGSAGGSSRSTQGTSLSGVSMDDFQKHIKPNDCWVLIEGEVYDISGFIKQYPSQGKESLQYCGTVGFEVGFLEENKIRDSVKEYSTKIGIIG